LGDIWAARPNILAEGELAEEQAAEFAKDRQLQRHRQAVNIKGDAYLCKVDGYSKAETGHGFDSAKALERHLDSHNAEANVYNDRYLCTMEVCPRAAPGTGLPTHSALIGHMRSHEHVNADSYLCTDSDCGRSKSGKGFKTSKHLERHMESHDRGVAESEPLNKHTQTSCSDPRCGHITPAFFYAKHQEQHVDGRFACRACGLRYYHAAYANEHALHECRVEDAATIHIPPPMKVVCTEPRCGHWRENTDLGNADMKKHIEARHVKGKGK
jgi:hypothetical protein